MSVQAYSVFDQTEEKKGGLFLHLSYELSLICRINVNYYQVFIILFLLMRIGKIQAIFKIN